MKKTTVWVDFSILSYWHAGSGQGRSAVSDALVQNDRNGLPFLPGRTVKGLLREGCGVARGRTPMAELFGGGRFSERALRCHGLDEDR